MTREKTIDGGRAFYGFIPVIDNKEVSKWGTLLNGEKKR